MHFAVRTAVLAAALIQSGCLERKESIVVDASGGVSMKSTFQANSLNELREGDAAPSFEGGWWVQERQEQRAQPANPGGMAQAPQTVYILEAELKLPPGADLPANFAAIGEADADVYLQFPTTLAIERRGDGTYYHFHRFYPRREWAQFEATRKPIQDQLASLGQKKPEEMTEADFAAMAQTLAELEVVKHLYWARAAFLDATPNAPQDIWLAMRGALSTVASELDYQPLLRLLGTPEQNERNEEAIQRELRALQDGISQRMEAKLKSVPNYSGRRLASFMQAYDWHRRFFDVTEDLGDDSFEIAVTMPGEIIGSNAAATNGATATWKFNGDAIRDRDLELMVSSKLR
jgi:hypothetical protein